MVLEAETEILGALVEHEASLAALYESFAVRLPEHAEFWTSMAGDERGHSARLARLRSEPGIEDWLRRDSGVRPTAVRSSVAYVRAQTERARAEGVGWVQALSIAVDLENALIEAQFARPSGSTCEPLAAVLSALAAETERHRRLLTDALEAERESRRRAI